MLDALLLCHRRDMLITHGEMDVAVSVSEVWCGVLITDMQRTHVHTSNGISFSMSMSIAWSCRPPWNKTVHVCHRTCPCFHPMCGISHPHRNHVRTQRRMSTCASPSIATTTAPTTCQKQQSTQKTGKPQATNNTETTHKNEWNNTYITPHHHSTPHTHIYMYTTTSTRTNGGRVSRQHTGIRSASHQPVLGCDGI